MDTGTSDANSNGDFGDDASAEILTVSGTATGALTVTGGAAGDSVTAGTGNDTINGGAGADTIAMANNLTYEDTIDGGAGTDTMTKLGQC